MKYMLCGSVDYQTIRQITLNPTAMNNHGSPQICAKLS